MKLKKTVAFIAVFVLVFLSVSVGVGNIHMLAVSNGGTWRFYAATTENGTVYGVDRETTDNIYIRFYSDEDATGNLLYQTVALKGTESGGNSGEIIAEDVPTSVKIKSIQIIKPDGTDDWGCAQVSVYYTPSGSSEQLIWDYDPDQWVFGSDGNYQYFNTDWFCEEHNHSITFDGNGATGGSTDSMNLVWGTTDALNANGFMKEGYAFAGWSGSLNGPVIHPDESAYGPMPDSNVTLYAKWIIIDQVRIDLSVGQYDIETDAFIPLSEMETLNAGDTITVRICPETDFLVGASRYIVMFSKDVFSIVGSNNEAFTPNLNNTFYSTVAAGYSGVTNIPNSAWPSTFDESENYNIYTAVAVGNNANTNSPNGGYPGSLPGDWLFSFKLQVKQDISADIIARIWLDSRWVRSLTNPHAAAYFSKCDPGQYSSQGNSIANYYSIDFTDADKAIRIGERVSIQKLTNSTTVINRQIGHIYGLEPGLTQNTFQNQYIQVNGNGRLEFIPTDNGFGTETKVMLYDNATNTLLSTYNIVIFGDVNGDSIINAIDSDICILVQNWMIEWDETEDAAFIKAGDVNGDGRVDAVDADIITLHENWLVTINQTTGLAS